MAAIDIERLMTDIKGAALLIVGKDLGAVKGFSDRQMKAIGQQAELVAGGILSGQITEDTREFFLDGIERMTQNFLETLQGLFWVTVEKLWNAVVDIVWGAINGAIKATGVVLPVPSKV